MVFIFFVQGEGRGHLTQAVSLKEKLLARGHKIETVVIGTKDINDLPSFFKEAFLNIPLVCINSPKFSKDKKQQGIDLKSSFFSFIKNLPRYRQEIKKIGALVAKIKPDALINFYEPLAGMYWRKNKNIPLFCLGHQYFFEHPSFPTKSLTFLQKKALYFYNHLSAPIGANKIALSFTKETDCKTKKIFVVPPLIREAILKARPQDKNFILTYLLNHGYLLEIIDWCKDNPAKTVRCFCDKKNFIYPNLPVNLEINYLSGEKFINSLTDCSALAASGGFETIIEASYLGKPILMVPTKNHFEQKGNAGDAQRAELAISNKYFDLSLLNKEKTHSFSGRPAFKEWVDNYSNKIIEIIEGKIIF